MQKWQNKLMNTWNDLEESNHSLLFALSQRSKKKIIVLCRSVLYLKLSPGDIKIVSRKSYIQCDILCGSRREANKRNK